MIEMTLSSRHRIRNSSPGGLRPSTLPLGHGGSPPYWRSHVDGEETFLFLSNRRDREPSPELVKGSGANHYPRAPAQVVYVTGCGQQGEGTHHSLVQASLVPPLWLHLFAYIGRHSHWLVRNLCVDNKLGNLVIYTTNELIERNNIMSNMLCIAHYMYLLLSVYMQFICGNYFWTM